MIYMNEKTQQAVEEYIQEECKYPLILQGKEHSGRILIAKEIAMKYLECSSLDESADFLYLGNTGKITIDDVRDVMDKSRIRAAKRGKRKVLLFEHAETMSFATQSILLKPLEDGQEDILFLFVAEENLVPAIQSRCKKIYVEPLDLDVGSENLNQLIAGRYGVKKRYEHTDFFDLIENVSIAIDREDYRKVLELLGCMKEKDKNFFYEKYEKEEVMLFLEFLNKKYILMNLEDNSRNLHKRVVQIGANIQAIKQGTYSKNDFLELMFALFY